ncbi:MAG: Small subunit (SSU) processome component [Sclerophora amabilis]|nr:MAG: Small subunit (SSU) processome component [Sclerophora amabilis]
MVSKRSSHSNSHVASSAPKAEPTHNAKRRRTQETNTEASLIQKLNNIKQLAGDVRKPAKHDGDTLGSNRVNESRTVVTSGGDADSLKRENGVPEIVEISSGVEEDLDDLSDSSSVSDGVTSGPGDVETAEDHEMADVSAQEGATEGDAEFAAPSFGELTTTNYSEPIDVEDAFATTEAPSNAIIQPSGSRSLQPPSAASLGTVLAQALKTSDVDLLESCLHMSDIETVRSTIQRLPSSLASTLLQKLAERLHRRPGRAGNLMIWVQWTLVSHGGHLASQPELMNKLRTLHKVIKERASGLQSLLSLKGKLDMLEAQMQLRKNIKASADAGSSDDDEEGVIYVEGPDDEEDSEEEGHGQMSVVNPGRSRLGRNKKPTGLKDDLALLNATGDEEEDDDEDNMPTTVNGITVGSDSDDDEDSSDEDLIDSEAEETEADTGEDLDEDDVDHDDIDSAEDDSEEEAYHTTASAGLR